MLTSRLGPRRLAGKKNRSLRGAVSYLKTLPGLDLRLEACDASSSEALQSVLSKLDLPVAGCMMMAVLLSDSLFMKQTPATFGVPFKGKTEAFHVLENAIDIAKLDFFIAVTSVSGLGAAGQTNYSR